MEIYLDVLIGVNTYICWILLYLTKSVFHIRVKGKYIALASLVGGVSSLLCLIPQVNIYVKLIAITLRVSAFMLIVFIGFCGYSIKRKLLYALVYILLNFLLSGAVLPLQNRTSKVVLYNGAVYFDVSLLLLVTVTVAVYISISVIEKLLSFKHNSSRKYTVKLKYRQTLFDLPALADTGNTARDIFSGLPVILCQGISLYGSDEPCRVVPYTTVAGEGLLYAVKPDFVLICDEKGNVKSVDALCADIESNTKLAIFNPILLN